MKKNVVLIYHAIDEAFMKIIPTFLAFILFIALFSTGCEKEEKDTELPQVSITSPTQSSKIMIDSTFTVKINAADNNEIVKVELLIDGILKGSDLNSPYEIEVQESTLQLGLHTLQAKAYDPSDNVGSSAEITIEITGFAPEAEFTASETTVAVGESIDFADQSLNDPTGWSWDFGDGGSSTSQNPSYTYTAAGTYNVSLTVSNDYGDDTETKTDYISVGDPPVAEFSASETEVIVGESIQFTDQSSNNPTGWNWDFGDGGSSTSQNPSYTYSTVGTYNVSLSVTNDYGDNTETKTGYITVGSPPDAEFTASETTVAVGESIQFTDQSTNNPASWNWDFGDGESSTSQNPTHIYSNAGTYDVSLTVTNSYGNNTETKTDYITVGDPPAAAFTASKTLATVGESIQFTDQSSNNPESWSWDFGDGNTSTEQSPSHNYSTEGTYTVSLTVTNTYGENTETKDDYITVSSTASWPRDTQTEVVDVMNTVTGKTWMDRNLGASQAAISSTDASAYGDLYQWGRAADGHEKRNSGTSSTLSSSDTPGHGNYIKNSSSPYDWRSPQNDNLWQGENGINNPCPSGYRLPTEAEWDAERQSWSSNNSAGAFASQLKLTLAGNRRSATGTLSVMGSFGDYWSSTVGGSRSQSLLIYSSDAGTTGNYRAFGRSVRCIKNE